MGFLGVSALWCILLGLRYTTEISQGKIRSCWKGPREERHPRGVEVEHQEVASQEHWKGQEEEEFLRRVEEPLEEAEDSRALCGCECVCARGVGVEDF